MGALNVDCDQKSTRLNIFRYLLSPYEDDPGDFIERVITQVKTRIHHFDPESTMEAPWLTPPKTFKSVHSQGR